MRTIIKSIEKKGVLYNIEQGDSVFVVVNTQRPKDPRKDRHGLPYVMEMFNTEKEAEDFINNL